MLESHRIRQETPEVGGTWTQYSERNSLDFFRCVLAVFHWNRTGNWLEVVGINRSHPAGILRPRSNRFPDFSCQNQPVRFDLGLNVLLISSTWSLLLLLLWYWWLILIIHCLCKCKRH